LILDEFEGEQNIEIIEASNFLESMKNLGLATLSEIEIACLMRVLTKPEINHSIVLNELIMVMENFGLPDEAPEAQPSKEEVVQKKQK
jgi:hypothetical protein